MKPQLPLLGGVATALLHEMWQTCDTSEIFLKMCVEYQLLRIELDMYHTEAQEQKSGRHTHK